MAVAGVGGVGWGRGRRRHRAVLLEGVAALASGLRTVEKMEVAVPGMYARSGQVLVFARRAVYLASRHKLCTVCI